MSRKNKTMEHVMKLQFLISLYIFSLACFGQVSLKSAIKDLPMLKQDEAVKIMILGTFHFDYNENISDVKGENNFDINSQIRQEQLNEVIEKIKLFNPTKIAVEMMVDDQHFMDSMYESYQSNKLLPGKNEAYQIGFKLGDELGLTRINCVDNRPEQIEINHTIDDWEEYAKKRNELQLWKAYDTPNEETNNYIDSIRQLMTLNDYFIFLNSEKNKLRHKQFFLTGLVNLGAGDTYLGADLTGYWYRRNTRIFTNIKKLAKTKQERILVIYGNSHAWVLEELFNASPEFEVIEVEDILGH